ncbi:hypothetical protein PQR39_26335 [Paraburkholderia sediminicola]|uniref:hypothetical protein n=1 Tax=Paraburkholderia sediminicola TaxID=458836 RepID=UPI0038BCF2DA
MGMITVAREDGRRKTNLALQIEVVFVEESERQCVAIVVQMPRLRMEGRGWDQAKLLQARRDQTYTANDATAGEGHVAFAFGFERVVLGFDCGIDARYQVRSTFAFAVVYDAADDAVQSFVKRCSIDDRRVFDIHACFG